MSGSTGKFVTTRWYIPVKRVSSFKRDALSNGFEFNPFNVSEPNDNNLFRNDLPRTSESRLQRYYRRQKRRNRRDSESNNI